LVIVELYPNKFQNKTNGVTSRRWLYQANPSLGAFITQTLGNTDDWLVNLDLLKGLRAHVDNPKAISTLQSIKRQNKERLANYIKKELGITVNVDSLFDVQIKRIHEYKRQLLNILGVIYRYRYIKSLNPEERAKVVPRTIIFGGKAAPGYYMAKLIIKLICSVSDVINKDREVGNLLKVVFIPNYCVSLAEIIIPASDVSQHISTAGMEASGTSNMKFAMNASLILGTLDGANIEIAQEIGRENIFIFGAEAQDVPQLRKQLREGKLKIDPRFKEVLGMIQIGMFGSAEPFEPIINGVNGSGDYYLLGYDFPAYLAAQDRIDVAYLKQEQWIKMSLLSIAGTGYFSSDRTIKEYAKDIWNVQPCRRPGPMPVPLERLPMHGIIGHDVASPLGRAVPGSNILTLERLSPV